MGRPGAFPRGHTGPGEASYPLSRHPAPALRLQPREGSPPIPDGRTDPHPSSGLNTTATVRMCALGGRQLPPRVGSEGSCSGLRARSLTGPSALA